MEMEDFNMIFLGFIWQFARNFIVSDCSSRQIKWNIWKHFDLIHNSEHIRKRGVMQDRKKNLWVMNWKFEMAATKFATKQPFKKPKNDNINDKLAPILKFSQPFGFIYGRFGYFMKVYKGC